MKASTYVFVIDRARDLHNLNLIIELMANDEGLTDKEYSQLHEMAFKRAQKMTGDYINLNI